MDRATLRVLLVEDDEDDYVNIHDLLSTSAHTRYSLQWVSSYESGLRAIASQEHDVYLIDQYLGARGGLDLLKEVNVRGAGAPFILLTGRSDYDLDMEAMRAGVADFLDKGELAAPLLERSIRYAIERKRAEELLQKAHDELEERVQARTAQLTASNERLEQEIAARIGTENALRESEKRYRELADSLPQFVFEMGSHGNLTFANRAAVVSFGYTRDEFVGLNALDLLAPEEREKAQRNFLKKIAGEKLGPNEYMMQRKDGTRFPTVVYSSPIMHDGEPIGLRGIVIDITERKRTEEDLLQAQKLESLGSLAGGIAHDFNNLLGVILGNISLARMILEPGGKAPGLLQEAEKAIFRAKDLSEQIIKSATSGLSVKRMEPIGQLVLDAVKLGLSGSNVKCCISLQDGLWPVECDAEQIRQMATNLIMNAEEAVVNGGFIEVEAKNVQLGADEIPSLEAGKYVKLSIRDFGLGIAKENLSKIFDPYFSTKARGTQKGMGLGLSISYSIARRHDGHISVESAIGAGTTFHAYLPAAMGRCAHDSEEGLEFVTGSLKVLYMEDDELLGQVAHDMVSYMGHEIETVRNGDEAVKKYVEAKELGMPFDVVILDLTIRGGMGGKETVRKLLEIDPSVRAIVTSGYSLDPVLSNFRDFGFSDAIAKPCQLQQLREVLQKVVD